MRPLDFSQNLRPARPAKTAGTHHTMRDIQGLSVWVRVVAVIPAREPRRPYHSAVPTFGRLVPTDEKGWLCMMAMRWSAASSTGETLGLPEGGGNQEGIPGGLRMRYGKIVLVIRDRLSNRSGAANPWKGQEAGRRTLGNHQIRPRRYKLARRWLLNNQGRAADSSPPAWRSYSADILQLQN